MDLANYTSIFDKSKEDPRTKSSKYSKGSRVKFDQHDFDFAFTQFLIDNNYVGEPPHVQVSIDNLNDNIDEAFLERDLKKFGQLKALEIIRHPRTKQHLGLAKVQFEDVSVAKACVENFNGKQLMGRQLKVFMDIRFTLIDKLVSEKLNPRPQPKPQSRQRLEDRIATLMRQPNCVLSSMIPVGSLSSAASTAPSASPAISITSQTASLSLSSDNHDYANNSYYHPQQPYNSSFRESDKARPDLDHIDHPRPTNLLKNHNYHHNINDQNSSIHNSSSFKNLYQQRLESNQEGPTYRYREKNIEDEDRSNTPIEEEEKKPLTLSMQHIEKALPYCWERFYDELLKNLISTMFRKLKEGFGYQIIEKAQADHKHKKDLEKLKADQKTRDQQLQKQYETRFINTKFRLSNFDRHNNNSRSGVQVIRQRTGHNNSIQNDRSHGESDMRRVNRSSAFVNEPDRRGSRSTSLESDFSDDDSRLSRASSISSSSSYSSRSGSRSSSYDSDSRSDFQSRTRSRSRSYSPISTISGDSRRRNRKSSKKSRRADDMDDKQTVTVTGDTKVMDYSTNDLPISQDERSTVDALLELSTPMKQTTIETKVTKPTKQKSQNIVPKPKTKFLVNDDEDDDDAYEDEEELYKPKNSKKPQSAGRKRKVKNQDFDDPSSYGVASEYRSAKKRFASEPMENQSQIQHDLFDENAMMVDENLFADQTISKEIFDERSTIDKDSIINNFLNLMTEEDLKYLKQVHDTYQESIPLEDRTPFGSDETNVAHLCLDSRKRMIEGKATEGHPKWWRGCSRCDVIEVSEKQKVQDEEATFEDLQKAPIKSNVIQAATSSRRDLRGDQRRIAVLNPELDADILKLLTTNTLQMRAKNLRFSRSKIHKWGLFACEKIASGDAVIEYVGEKIRPSLADHREKVVYTNLPTHDGSSYFFRVDTDVIDATLKGNKARFINHCCNPNCIAKVIKHDNGSDSIVIYAKQPIQEDEEITYDYKFPIEETEQKIQCNCKAPNCRKTLN